MEVLNNEIATTAKNTGIRNENVAQRRLKEVSEKSEKKEISRKNNKHEDALSNTAKKCFDCRHVKIKSLNLSARSHTISKKYVKIFTALG